MPPYSAGHLARGGHRGQWYLTFVRTFALVAVLAALACWPIAILIGASGSIRNVSPEDELLQGSSQTSSPSVRGPANEDTDDDSTGNDLNDLNEHSDNRDYERDVAAPEDKEGDLEDEHGGKEHQYGESGDEERDKEQAKAENEKESQPAEGRQGEEYDTHGGEDEQTPNSNDDDDVKGKSTGDENGDGSSSEENSADDEAAQNKLIDEIEEEVDEESKVEEKIEEQEENASHTENDEKDEGDQEGEPEEQDPVEVEELSREEQEQESDESAEYPANSEPLHPGPPDDPDYSKLKKQLNSFAYRKTHKHNDVEPLSDDRSPLSYDWDNSVAICAIMKGEFMTDIREWLLYHRWLGVSKVYLMENVEDPTPEVLEQLQDFIDAGFVEYSNIGRRVYQLFWYRDCMDNYHHLHNWMAFIDVDEYIVIKDEKFTSLPDFLDEFRHSAGLVMHWTLVGPSGQKTRPKNGGMLRNYDKCREWPAALVKTIANTYFIQNIAGNPHTFEYRHNMQAVDENKKAWPWRWEPECSLNIPDDAPYDKRVLCRPIPERQNRAEWRSFDRITVNHYLTKSEEDFKMKVDRGSGGGVARKWTEFYELQSEATHDCPWAKQAAELCCPEDQYILKVESTEACSTATCSTASEHQ